MIRWLVVVAGLMVVIALWSLPPASIELPRSRDLPERISADALEAELRRTHAALRALRWSDSLSALALRSAVDGFVLSLPRAPGMDPEAVQAWGERRRTELAGLEPRSPDMIVGSLWVPADEASVPGVPVSAAMRDVTFVGERDGAPYCLQAIPYTERTTNALLQSTPGAAACNLYGKYGPAGPYVQEWLNASALGFARVSVPTFAEDFARTGLGLEPPRLLFGQWRPRFAGESPTAQACLAGRAVACERAMTEPTLLAPGLEDEAWVIANSPASDLGIGFSSPPFGYLDDGLLFELEARYGPSAFARFWTSDAPVPAAFQAAFGEPLGEWILRWIGGHVGLYRAGPSVPWSTLAWSVLALMLLGALASAAAVRRRPA